MPDEKEKVSTETKREEVMDALRAVTDPEIGISVIDLGLIYGVEIDDKAKACRVKMTLTSRGCPAGGQIMAGVEHVARAASGLKDVKVELVWEPPWDPRIHASEDGKFLLGII